MTLKRIEIEISEPFDEQYRGKYVLREMTFGTRNKILEECFTFNAAGELTGQNLAKMNALNIARSLVSQPEKANITLEKLMSQEEDGVPYSLATKLNAASQKLNGTDVEQAHFLLTLLNEADRTQLLQSFGYVRHSDVSRAH